VWGYGKEKIMAEEKTAHPYSKTNIVTVDGSIYYSYFTLCREDIHS